MSNVNPVKASRLIDRFKYDSPRHLLIPEEANLLVDGHNRVENMEIKRGQQDRVVISDHKITLELRDSALDSEGNSSAGTGAFHPFRAYIVPEADCNDPATFGRCIQVRAGIVEFRSEYYLSIAVQGITDNGPLTQIQTQPTWPVQAGSDGVVGQSGLGLDYTSTSTGSGVSRTSVAVGNAGDYGDAGFAQFVFSADLDDDSVNLAAIWIEITEGDDVTAPTFAIKARHYSHNPGATGRTTTPWPTGLVIPLALMDFSADVIENLNSGHVIARNLNRSQGLIFRGDWDTDRYFYIGDEIFYEVTVGDYVIRHWRAIVGNRNVEPVDLSLTTWYPLDPKYVP